MPTYIEFDQTKPLGTQSGPQAIDSILHNLLALREKTIIGGIAGFTFSTTVGTGSAKRPQFVFFIQDPVRVRGTIDWTRARLAEIDWEYSTNSGTLYDPMLTQTFTYNTAGYLTGIAGASSFSEWMMAQFLSVSNREAVITLTVGNGNNDLDWDLGGVATLTATGADCEITSLNLPNGVAGTMVVEVIDGGEATLLFPGVHWPGGTVPTFGVAGTVDIVVLYSRDGATVHASLTNADSRPV